MKTSSHLIDGDYHKYQGSDYQSYFANMVANGLNWNIVLLTTNSECGMIAKEAAQINGIQLRWYGMNSEGKLRSLYVKKENHVTLEKFQMPFKLSTELISIGKAINFIERVPSTGTEVNIGNNGDVIQLKRAVMTDHFSITYMTDNPKYFAKIYTSNSLQLNMWENKAKRMLQAQIDIAGVCWPKDIIKDKSDRFVGILIPSSEGIQLTRSVMNGLTGLSEYFPNWNRNDLCMLSKTILDKICKMHSLGLLFGCINPASIYVVSPTEVYFVDVDSWQVEGYPATSRNKTFTPPELLQDNVNQLLYTMDQENYQVGLLTFMLMMPGKFPYSKKNSFEDNDSIKNMSFPFSVGG